MVSAAYALVAAREINAAQGVGVGDEVGAAHGWRQPCSRCFGAAHTIGAAHEFAAVHARWGQDGVRPSAAFPPIGRKARPAVAEAAAADARVPARHGAGPGRLRAARRRPVEGGGGASPMLTSRGLNYPLTPPPPLRPAGARRICRPPPQWQPRWWQPWWQHTVAVGAPCRRNCGGCVCHLRWPATASAGRWRRRRRRNRRASASPCAWERRGGNCRRRRRLRRTAAVATTPPAHPRVARGAGAPAQRRWRLPVPSSDAHASTTGDLLLAAHHWPPTIDRRRPAAHDVPPTIDHLRLAADDRPPAPGRRLLAAWDWPPTLRPRRLAACDWPQITGRPSQAVDY